MWAKICKSREEKTIQNSDFLPHQSQVASETSCEKSAAPEWRNVDVLGEESKGKSSTESIKDLESLGEEEKDVKSHADDQTNSSFLHAVINMVGMVIGKCTHFP